MQNIFTILVFGVLFTAILANPTGRATCPESYAPCVCDLTANGLEITCTNVSPADVKNVFYRTSALDLYSVTLTKTTTGTVDLLPDQLSNKRTGRIFLNCPSNVSPKVQLRIDRLAVEYSRLNTTVFEINNCDLSGQPDLNFLTGFVVLDSLRIRNTLSVEAVATFPRLDALKELTITDCTGLSNVAATFPDLTPARLERLYLDGNGLTDTQVNGILISVGSSSSVSSLQYLAFQRNTMTKVPRIASFSQLISYSVSYNNIPFISEAALIFGSPVISVGLRNLGLTAIEGGAFQGDYTFAQVNLSDNSLAEFREDVFKAMLQQMAAQSGNGGKVIVSGNPFGCGCELAWLIYSNRDLIPSVSGGVCGGFFKFEDLNPDSFGPSACP